MREDGSADLCLDLTSGVDLASPPIEEVIR